MASMVSVVMASKLVALEPMHSHEPSRCHSRSHVVAAALWMGHEIRSSVLAVEARLEGRRVELSLGDDDEGHAERGGVVGLLVGVVLRLVRVVLLPATWLRLLGLRT